MQFFIADTFTDSIARLTRDEQKLVKTTAFDLQLDPAGSGKNFHRIEQSRDRNFWSVRAGSDLRLIVHKAGDSMLLCYADHHDPAYAWAERRRLETHPRTGAAQFVETRETVQEIVTPVPGPKRGKPALFVRRSDDELLGCGVPAEWLADVRAVTEDTLAELCTHLPAEAGEALWELAVNGTVRRSAHPPADNPLTHPDAQRRFRIMGSAEELRQALDYPWDKWAVFLHPEQRQWASKSYAGPARVCGSAGTGKTIVALHRAAWLARTHPDRRVLLTTFSPILAENLRGKLKRLLAEEPRTIERIDVAPLDALGTRLHRLLIAPVVAADPDAVIAAVREAFDASAGHKFLFPFVLSEWTDVVDAWDLHTWEEYRDFQRLGRKVRLTEAHRLTLWRIFAAVRQTLTERKLTSRSSLFTALAVAVAAAKNPPFDFAVVDEAQDLGVADLRLLAAIGGGRPDALFFAGDTGQRIFQTPFAWKALGVDVRGRSRTLKVNYRTSHQIRSKADRLLAATTTDADGNDQERDDTVSLFDGPTPEVRTYPDATQESAAVGDWLAGLIKSGLRPQECGVFVRSLGELDRAREAVARAGAIAAVLDDRGQSAPDRLTIGTMHQAKGLEFRAVAVMACDEDVIPSPSRIEAIGDGGDMEEAYRTERHLLYVACTRARDHLLVTCAGTASEFLSDLKS